MLHLLARDAKAELGKDLMALLMGGKRLRGGLTMLIFDSFSDGKGDRTLALDLAAAIELAHASSLVLDDIIDEDETRRGARAIHILEGEKRAILRMVAAISLPYTIASSHGDAFVAPLAEVQRRMARGALAEMAGTPFPTMADYERVITLKTGELFGLAAYYGAVVAGCGPELAARITRFGLEVGKVMQMADDIADLRKAFFGACHVSRGSEMMLLNTVIPVHLANDIEGDLKARRLTSVRAKLQEAMGPDWFDLELKGHLATELRKITIIANDLWSCEPAPNSQGRPFPEMRRIIEAVPSEIAILLFEELDSQYP